MEDIILKLNGLLNKIPTLLIFKMFKIFNNDNINIIFSGENVVYIFMPCWHLLMLLQLRILEYFSYKGLDSILMSFKMGNFCFF